MKALRVAAVGAGYFSQFHYEAWARIPEVEVIGACDRDLAKAKATGVPAFEDLKAMLSKTQPDLLDIILPPVAHQDAIQCALDAGVKTLICQKPFCRNFEEAQAMTEAVEAAGARLVVHENFRFQPWYRHLKSVMDDGLVGEVQQVTFRLRPGDGQGPEAYLDRQPYFQKMQQFLVHETAVHWIDTFRYLLGNPSAVYADLRQVNPVIAGEDAGYILFDHPLGVRALFDGNRSLDHAADNLRCTMGEALIEGTTGALTLDGAGALWHRPFGARQAQCIFQAPETSGFGGDCVHALQSHVVSGLLKSTPLENLAREYLDVIRVEEAVYHSAELGQKLPLDLS